MSSAPSIRLLALPLAKPQAKRSLIYFYAQPLTPAEPSTPQASSDRSLSPPVLIKKATDLGAKQWHKLGLSPRGSWKFKIHTSGERFMDKIPFEEWALKSIDPGTIPRPLVRSEKASSTGKPDTSRVIELLYPGSLFKAQELIEGLKKSMSDCQPYHKKWMKLNIFLSPLTLPLGIIPLLPNLPFFYMMWRAWSHWRAYNASRYLHQMIEHGHLQPIPSPILDTLYAQSSQRNVEGKGSSERSSADSERNDKLSGMDANDLILSDEMVTRLQQKLDLPRESASEISRGIQQAKLRLLQSSPHPDSPNHPSHKH